jgi:2-succinyl-6-hydroxy-2,4-cyclohexadiene-1-carboxylate synthase
MPSSTDGADLKTVFAINGFLGQMSDWNLIRDLLPKGWQLHAIDVWNEPALVDYDEWSRRITEEINRDFPKEMTKVVIGYSMGGRLAMHLLAHSPALFDGAVIVSANPGLLAEDERVMRRESDARWADKFLTDPWPNLMKEWNAQSALSVPAIVDSDQIVFDRKESEFDRTLLARALRTWTLGAQRNLRTDMAKLKLPIEFITGEADVKFTSLTRELMKMQARGSREHVVVTKAGHRVPWDAPTQFRSILAKFLAHW